MAQGATPIIDGTLRWAPLAHQWVDELFARGYTGVDGLDVQLPLDAANVLRLAHDVAAGLGHGSLHCFDVDPSVRAPVHSQCTVFLRWLQAVLSRFGEEISSIYSRGGAKVNCGHTRRSSREMRDHDHGSHHGNAGTGVAHGRQA